MNRQLLAALALVPALFACETIDSADVRTSGIHANIDITADGSGATSVRTELRAGGGTSNTFLELAEGDALYAFAEQDQRAMRERGDPFDRVWYEADFETDAPDVQFRVEFARDEHEDADESMVRMPAPFSLTEPRADAVFAFDDETIPLAWDVSTDDEMQLEVTGDCIWPFERALAADTGRYLLHPGTLTPRERWKGGTCALEIQLIRTRHGALDPGFQSGRIRARQVREVEVKVTR